MANTVSAKGNSSRRSTAFAIGTALILTVPAYVLGSLAAIIFTWVYAQALAVAGGHVIPFIDSVMEVIFLIIAPDAIRAFVGIYCALLISLRIFKRADSGKVICYTAGAWAVLMLIASGFALYVSGPDIRHFATIGTLGGIAGGALGCAYDRL